MDTGRPPPDLLPPLSELPVSWLVAGGFALVALVWWRLRKRQRQIRQAWTDPSIDLGEWQVDSDARERMIFAFLTKDPVTRVRNVLEATDGEHQWREPLRRLTEAAIAAEMAGASGLVAEWRARMGYLPDALVRAETLAPDDPAGCFVRALHYRSIDDPERAESALVAAVWFSDPADRPRYARALARHRARFRRKRTEAEQLWDPA